MNPIVCAVIVTYNRKLLLRECLGALSNQSVPLERIIVVNNASTDGTQEMVGEEFPGVELSGRGVAMHASLPEGRTRSQEALIVVALRGRRRLENLFPAAGDAFRSASGSEAMALASEFLAPLLSIPASEWTFDQIVYSISED